MRQRALWGKAAVSLVPIFSLGLFFLLAFVLPAGILMSHPARSQAVSAHPGGPVYVLSVNGEIEPGLAAYLARGIQQAEQAQAAALLLEIGTFGGRVDAAVEIRDRLLATRIPVITFVKNEAWSAGALLTLAGRHIVMAPGSTMGAAEPIPKTEKTVSALRSLFAATAERYGRNPRLAEGMVDRDLVIPGRKEKGKLLSLTATEAKEVGFAEAILADRAAVLRHFGLGEAQVRELRPAAAERLARFFTTSWVSQLLLALGFLGIVIEFMTPGWGFPGLVGAISLFLFFGARLLAGLAGWETVFLFLLGLILLALEAFVIPGFGLAGLSGLAALFGSIYLSFGNLAETITSLGVALILSLATGVILFRYGWRRGLWNRFILQVEQKPEEGYSVPTLARELVGREGKALTPLRPAGVVLLGGARYDALTEGDFIPKGATVRVVRTAGGSLVVEAVGD